MLSARLVHIIESHAEELTQRFVEQLKTHARTPSYQRLPQHDVHETAYKVYKHLGAWLEGRAKDHMPRHYEEIGRRRFEAGIPISEVMYAIVLSKKTLLTYVRNNAWGGTPMEIFGEEELVNRVNQFYDDAIYYTALGYQNAALEGRHHAAAASHA